jgi:hypothetical protein
MEMYFYEVIISRLDYFDSLLDLIFVFIGQRLLYALGYPASP